MRNGYIFFGYLAALLTTFSGIPQIIRVVKLKESRDISLWTASLLSAGVLFWLIHGLIIRDVPLTISSGLSLLFSTITICVILKYR
jgi:MtN3 and saliva related transmembrane protein